MSSFKLKDNVKDNINKMKKNNKTKPVKFNFKQERRSVPASQHEFIKPVDKPISEKRNLITKQYLDNRVKYWIDSRLSMVINSNSLLSRGVHSIKIEPDYSQGGESFMFVVNGEVVAKITDRGFIYCRNLLMNGYDLAQVLNNVYNEQDGFKKNYVTHQELKDGTYEMDIKDIITKFLEVLIPTLTANESMNGLLFGKDDAINGNNAHLCFTYAGDDNVNNSLSLGFKGYTDQYIFYRDRCKFLAPFVSDDVSVPAITCINNGNAQYTHALWVLCPNLTTNRATMLVIGKTTTTGNSSYLRYHWAGNNHVNTNLSIGFYGYDNIYRFYRDRVEFFGKLRMRVNIDVPIEILSNKDTPTIYLGHDSSANNCMIIRYKHNTTPHSLGIGFYGNEDILTIDTNKNVYVNDGLFDVLCSTANKVYQKLEYNSTLDNSDYIRLQFNDDTKQGIIDFTKDTQYYKLKLGIDGATGCLTVNETGIEMDGDVDIHNDLTLWQGLWVKDINEAYSGENINLHNLTAIHLTSNDADNRALNIIDPNLSSNHSLSINIGIDDGTTAERNAYIKWYNNNITLSNRLAFGISGIGDIFGLFINHVYMNKRLDISLSSYIPRPIDIYYTVGLNNGQTYAVSVNDGNDASLNGLGKDSNGDYYSYMKLENGTAEIDVYSNKTVINEDLNVNGKLDTPNKTTATNALGSDLQKAIIDLVYPVGSYYMSGVELSGTKYMDGNTPKIDWMGCVWSPVSSHIFFRSSNVSISGSTWSYSDGGATGGNTSHYHLYGIRYAAFYGHMCGTNGDATQIYDNGSWVNTTYQSTTTGSFSSIGTSGSNGGSTYGRLARTTTSSHLPPYQNIYIYQRIA